MCGLRYKGCKVKVQIECALSGEKSSMDTDTALYISKALSYSVIALSFCMKFPQIITVFSSKASKGLSARGYWMEIAG